MIDLKWEGRRGGVPVIFEQKNPLVLTRQGIDDAKLSAESSALVSLETVTQVHPVLTRIAVEKGRIPELQALVAAVNRVILI